MVTYLIYLLAALYLGILTSISPCPLATNIAAISYIGRKVENSRLVINAGLLYTLGRCLLYLLLAALLTTTALSIPAVSIFLQKYMHLVLGPIFLLLGMFLVGLITISSGGTMMSEGMQKRVDAMGIWGALLLGILFAVSFCPTSAAWFFGLLALTMGSEAGAIHLPVLVVTAYPEPETVDQRMLLAGGGLTRLLTKHEVLSDPTELHALIEQFTRESSGAGGADDDEEPTTRAA